MKKAFPSTLCTILLGSILASCQTAYSVGEPEFAARPIVSNVTAENPDVPATVHCGKTLVIPVVANDPEGGPLSYTVTTNKPWLLARVRTGHPVMKMRVRSANDGTGAPIDGTMEFALFRAETPDTADFIAGFAQAPYFENVLFHRVIKNFVLQGGDPAGTGSGASPYTLPHEFNSHLVYSGRGQLAMANSASGYTQSFPSYGRTFSRTNQFGFPVGTTEYATARTTPTNGSQFFVTLGQPRHLDFKHTLFGQLLRGFEVMDKVANVPVNTSSKPNVNVTMSELSVKPSASDGILIVSATGIGNGVITVVARDVEGKTSSKTYAVTAVADGINDPPILGKLESQVVPLGDVPKLAVVAQDLESDQILTRVPVQITDRDNAGVSVGTNTFYASATAGVLNAVSRRTAGAWDMTVAVSGANDIQAGSSDFDASRFQMLEVGVGDKAIDVTPVTLEAKQAVATGSVKLASFRYGGNATTAGDLIASVNWGDGSALQGSNRASPAISVAPSATVPGAWDVKGSHTYARPGVYPLHVTIDGPLGATKTARGSAVVAAEGALFSALGQNLKVQGATFANQPIAIISDATPGVKPADFSVSIDWGDGRREPSGGTIRQIGAGRFGVFATHQYADTEIYSVMVTVTRGEFTTTAWSTLDVGGFVSPRYRAPFPKANLTSSWASSIRTRAGTVSGFPTLTTSGRRTTVSGYFTVFNGGEKPAKTPKLRFYLSNNATLEKTGPGADTLLPIGPASSTMKVIPLKQIGPEDGGTIPLQNENGLNLTVNLPPNETGAGRFLITDVDYTDPITDHMAVDKVVVFGPFRSIFYKLPPRPEGVNSYTLAEGSLGAANTALEFTVSLDTLPTADVVIPLRITDSNGTANDSRLSVDVLNAANASISQTEIRFTPQNGKIPQKIRISTKNNTIREVAATHVIRLLSATSTDARFRNNPQDIVVQVNDDDTTGSVAITVSKTTLELAENTTTTFTLTPSADARQNASLSIELVDENGVLVPAAQATVTATVTFNAASGINARTVTVTSINDQIANGTRNWTVRLKPIVSADTTFSGVDLADIPLTVTDDEQP